MVFETFDMKQANNKKFASVIGTPTLAEYEYKVDSNGVRQLVKTDRVTNVHDRIQADADSCDINKLMARFALGDTEALNQRDAFYADATLFPDNYADLFNRVEQCKQEFDKLPVDLKQLFDNSYEVYFASMGSKEFVEKYAEYNKRFENHQFDSEEVFDTTIKSDELVEVER